MNNSETESVFLHRHRTLDSDFLENYDDSYLENPASHGLGSSISLVKMSGDGFKDLRLPPIRPRRSQSPPDDSKYDVRKERRYGRNNGKQKSLLRTSMASSMRTNSPDDENPDPVPFQVQNFMSSTKLKKVHISKRHLDTFGGTEYSIPSKRGIILHSDRYSWEGARPLDGSISQRDRMRLEIDYIEKLRGLKKRKEVWPHRAEMDLLMAGKRIEFEERFDLNGELQHLKSLVLPDAARELFHGKGIRLPCNHASLKPRPNQSYLEIYGDIDVSASAPSALRSLNPRFAIDPDIRRGWPNTQAPPVRNADRRDVLPSINKHNNIRIGIGPLSETAVSLSQARRVTKGRKPSQPPGSILPQSKPAPLPRLELHPSRSYNTPTGTMESHTPAKEERSSVVQKPSTVFVTENGHSSGGYIATEGEPSTQVPIATNDEPSPHIATEDDAPFSYPIASGGEGEIPEDRIEIPQQAEASQDTPPNNTQPGETTGHKTPLNPLQGADLQQLISDGEKTELTETFQRLDTDNDGHLQYDQLKEQLPVPSHQEQYLRQVYDISSSQTFFGVDEFITMNALANSVRELSGPVADAFNTLEETTLQSNIMKYVEVFQSVDRMKRGYISLSSLREILSTTLEKDLKSEEEAWSDILKALSKEEEERLSKVEFLSFIPYFLSLSPVL